MVADFSPSAAVEASAARARAARADLDNALAAAKAGKPDQLWETAKAFEAAFIAEMLKHADLGETGGAFTGGHGEEAFRSFLVDEYANALSQSSDFGLAEKLYADLKQKVAVYDQ